jgi:hypothetical protein
MHRFSLEALHGANAPFVAGTFFDLATVGYQQAEYAIAGSAQAYARTGAGPDGLEVVEEADLRSRIVVHRPIDPADFGGTVWVEWLNVSGGLDAAPDWIFAQRELRRAGAAWIGVSAQQVGVQPGTSALGMVSSPLTTTDPERYGSLHHPGDRFSYDLFAAVGELARSGVGTILEDLPIERVLAIGESQSAFRLTTFVNEIDETRPAFDGYLVHARGGAASALDDGQDPRRLREGDAAPFRDGLRVPVLCLQAETDLITLGYRDARQDDADRLVVWEMAGTSHADVYTFAVGFADDGLRPLDELAAMWRPPQDLFGQRLDHPVNAGPQHWVVDAAVRALDRWVDEGEAARPPAAPRLELSGDAFATDEHGNARGGIRTPHVEVPTAVLSGLGNGGADIAFLTGSTLPFPRERLVELYGSPERYVERFRAAAEATVAEGFFVAEDLEEIVGIAERNVDL